MVAAGPEMLEIVRYFSANYGVGHRRQSRLRRTAPSHHQRWQHAQPCRRLSLVVFFVFCQLKLQPYRQNSLSLRRNLKLASKFYGPYQILERVGLVAYRLDHPPSAKIHPVFHVSLLKKKLGDGIVPTTSLPIVDSDGLFHLVPTSVLDRRSIHRAGGVVNQLLVQWGETELKLQSWEDVKFLVRKFPNSYPWGQGFLNPGGNVMGMDMNVGVVEAKKVTDSEEMKLGQNGS